MCLCVNNKSELLVQQKLFVLTNKFYSLKRLPDLTVLRMGPCKPRSPLRQGRSQGPNIGLHFSPSPAMASSLCG